MRRLKLAALTGLLLLALSASAGGAAAEGSAGVRVVVSSQARPAERLAAQDLVRCLRQLYPAEQFFTSERLPAAGRCILLGSADPEVRQRVPLGKISMGESYVVTSLREGGRQMGVIAGAEPPGTAYGVYALLEKLGCGFYLSGDALPPARQERFSFEGWELAGHPLVRDRLVFDWHNFLSGCSTWNLEDWQRWIQQSQKMGYNAVMVHAYGNNPMVTFEFNGRKKPVGYLSTTAKGRDWSTMHVNHVRRLWGGEVFQQAVFGAEAALGPDDQRAEAAQTLMREVFAAVEQRAMGVFFAVDVDTASANPQELILTLPAGSRFPIGAPAVQWRHQEGGRMWLANPETAEGYSYYRAQVAALLKSYPQITCLVVWFRTGGTPWMELKVSEMPAAWQRDYEAELARTPEAAKFWHAPQIFALGKIVRAFERALEELGSGGARKGPNQRVQLAAGSWDFKFLAASDRFFPPEVELIGLDYNVLHGRPQLADESSRKVLREVGNHRPVLPVVWAHHDDGNYIGRPYTPFTEFGSKLADAKASGFGVIHWTTRPLDLFFKSLSEQVWSGTKDRPLRATCEEMAERLFGPGPRAGMGGYLERWVTDAPKFGRETSDWFIDHPLTNAEQVITGCGERLKLLATIDLSKSSPEQRERVCYFEGLERFIMAFFQTHELYDRSLALLKTGDLAGARAAMTECQPERVIEQFAKFSSLGGMTRGEEGLMISLNLRWLTHIVRHRQALGLEPVRIKFGPTQHDPLAQAAGAFTFHFQPDRQVWECWGEAETGGKVFVLPAGARLTRAAETPEAWEEICRSGIQSDQPLTFTLRPIMARDSRGYGGAAGFPAGEFRLRLLFVDPSSTGPGQRLFDVGISTGAKLEQASNGGRAGTPVEKPRRDIASAGANDRIDIFNLAGGANGMIERQYNVTVGGSGTVKLTLTPVHGQALICGAVMEPK